jgi:hypothetical protein
MQEINNKAVKTELEIYMVIGMFMAILFNKYEEGKVALSCPALEGFFLDQ